MPIRAISFLATVALNFAFALLYNKAQSSLGASLLPASIVGLGVVGAVLYFAKADRSTVSAQAGWGLLAGSIASVVLCGVTILLIVRYMRG